MLDRLRSRVNAALAGRIPERTALLSAGGTTRRLRLSPMVQLAALLGAGAFVAWSAIATAIAFVSIAAPERGELSASERERYETRLDEIGRERDMRAWEAAAAQRRLTSTLEQVSSMQTDLLDRETRERELETGIGVIQATLRGAMKERERAERELEELVARNGAGAAAPDANPDGIALAKVDYLSAALADIAEERDLHADDAKAARSRVAEIAEENQLIRDHNDQIFRQIEEATLVSTEPLDKMFRSINLDPDHILETIRHGYSGIGGGALSPLRLSGPDEEPSPEEVRANAILSRLDRLNLYRIAAESIPLAMPTGSRSRFTSGFGPRWGRMHNGADFAGRKGSPIVATADGVVSFSGRLPEYGRTVRVKHEFGIETVYAHNSRNLVKKGDRVSRGQVIADMGDTGRSTGPHVHYEVRVNGTPKNPMNYIKAGRNVF